MAQGCEAMCVLVDRQHSGVSASAYMGNVYRRVRIYNIDIRLICTEMRLAKPNTPQASRAATQQPMLCPVPPWETQSMQHAFLATEVLAKAE